MFSYAVYKGQDFFACSYSVNVRVEPLPYVTVGLVFSIITGSTTRVGSPSFSLSSSSIADVVFPTQDSSDTSSAILGFVFCVLSLVVLGLFGCVVFWPFDPHAFTGPRGAHTFVLGTMFYRRVSYCSGQLFFVFTKFV